MKNLVFLDCETTGLNEAKDFIVEIALVAVTLPDFREVATFTQTVRPPLWETVKRNLHEKVFEMHTKSGLIRDLEARADECAVHRVEGEALAFVRDHAPHTPIWQTPMAGANPDFDRRFVRKHMAKLHAAFSYRNFDVRSITQLQDWVFGVDHVESPHRALADCRKAISDVRRFLGVEG